MIIDLPRFLRDEQPYWSELEGILDHLDRDATFRLGLDDAKRFHYLYERAAADLSKLTTFASEPRVRGYLEGLVGRAYGEIHETRERRVGVALRTWFFETFPQTFRRRRIAFYVSLGITMIGVVFGAAVIAYDYDSKAILMPFPGLEGDPRDRVEHEESSEGAGVEGQQGSFSAMLMTNNIRVSINALALGMTFGIGTIILLFYNGVAMGAVIADYIRAGETQFVAGWLLPHGSVEIPAILLAGQGGLVLGRALIGWGTSHGIRTRFREVISDVVTLLFGVAILLVWAGIIESFISQYHKPVLVYSVKIAFGCAELVALFAFLTLAGRKKETAT